MRQDIKKFVRECSVCQENNHETVLPAGLLQPLAIPSRVWSDIAMDFIEGLPLSHGFSVILVVIDHSTKYGHFLPLAHPYTASKVTQVFLANIFKLHGMPTTIVLDRNPTFTSSFWRELFHLQGISLAFSSTYYPQSDGKIEASTSASKHTSGVTWVLNLKSGVCGFLWLNGGTIQPTIHPRVSPPLKSSMAMHLQHFYPTFQALQPT